MICGGSIKPFLNPKVRNTLKMWLSLGTDHKSVLNANFSLQKAG